MFSYYGAKTKLIKYYPEPKHKIIIEPFAGSAQYAFHYWKHDVILVEKYDHIYGVWKWLIEEATPEFIMSLPLYTKGETVKHENPAVRDLMALECNCAIQGSPRFAVSGDGSRNRWSKKNRYGRKRIADNLHKIKHWKIIHGDYSLAPI